MKCPMCNGSGKCYEQKIWYQEIETNRTDFTIAKCHKCHGTGEVEMTNEEWFCSLPTEEKAMWLFRKCNYASVFGSPTSREFYEWLKEKHE